VITDDAFVIVRHNVIYMFGRSSSRQFSFTRKIWLYNHSTRKHTCGCKRSLRGRTVLCNEWGETRRGICLLEEGGSL